MAIKRAEEEKKMITSCHRVQHVPNCVPCAAPDAVLAANCHVPWHLRRHLAMHRLHQLQV